MKRQIWTTFCPSKVNWELSKIESKGGSASSDWLSNISLIDNSLELLKKFGITGYQIGKFFHQKVTKEG